MFGYVTANWKELTKQQRSRYGSIYCGKSETKAARLPGSHCAMTWPFWQPF